MGRKGRGGLPFFHYLGSAAVTSRRNQRYIPLLAAAGEGIFVISHARACRETCMYRISYRRFSLGQLRQCLVFSTNARPANLIPSLSLFHLFLSHKHYTHYLI